MSESNSADDSQTTRTVRCPLCDNSWAVANQEFYLTVTTDFRSGRARNGAEQYVFRTPCCGPCKARVRRVQYVDYALSGIVLAGAIGWGFIMLGNGPWNWDRILKTGRLTCVVFAPIMAAFAMLRGVLTRSPPTIVDRSLLDRVKGLGRRNLQSATPTLRMSTVPPPQAIVHALDELEGLLQ